MKRADSRKSAGNDAVSAYDAEGAASSRVPLGADAFGFRAWVRAHAESRGQVASDADDSSGPDAAEGSRDQNQRRVVSQATHNVMVANRGRDTKPELIVRHALREAGLPGYRLQWKAAPGRPDIAYPGRHIAIYVDGCFWHRCPYCNLPLPKSNADYWRDKFRRNIERDRRNAQRARDEGWEVIHVWECQLKGEKREQTLNNIIERVRNAGKQTETEPGTSFAYAQVRIDEQPAKKERTPDA